MDIAYFVRSTGGPQSRCPDVAQRCILSYSTKRSVTQTIVPINPAIKSPISQSGVPDDFDFDAGRLPRRGERSDIAILGFSYVINYTGNNRMRARSLPIAPHAPVPDRKTGSTGID
jgi:hypothetical protein